MKTFIILAIGITVGAIAMRQLDHYNLQEYKDTIIMQNKAMGEVTETLKKCGHVLRGEAP